MNREEVLKGHQVCRGIIQQEGSIGSWDEANKRRGELVFSLVMPMALTEVTEGRIFETQVGSMGSLKKPRWRRLTLLRPDVTIELRTREKC